MGKGQQQQLPHCIWHVRQAVGLILIIRWPRQTRNMVYVNKQSRPSGQVAKWLSRFGPLIKRALSID